MIMDYYYPLVDIRVTCRIISASLCTNTQTHLMVLVTLTIFFFIKQKLPSVLLILTFQNMKRTTDPTFYLSLD